jgi:hypothetical protein
VERKGIRENDGNMDWRGGLKERVLKDLERTGLSCGCMNRLNTHRFSPSPVSKFSLFLSLPLCRRSSLLTVEIGGLGWSQIIRQRESLVLYKSVDTICTAP